MVDAVRRAGAVVFGKTNLPRWSGDYQSYNEIFGTTNNPWDRGRTPGGSSSGTGVAVAARLTRSHYLHRVALLQHAVDKPPQRHGHAIDFGGEGFCHDGNPQTGELRSEGLDEEVVGGFHTPETRHPT